MVARSADAGSSPYRCARSAPSRDATNASDTGSGRMPDQQRGLQAERKVGDQSTRPTGRRIRFVSGHGTRERAGRREVGVEVAGLPPRQGHLRVERFEAVGLSCQRSKYIEGDDVARPLPHRHDGLLAVAPRKRERFGVAVAAEALESLVGVLGTALADPVFRDRRRESSEGDLAVDASASCARASRSAVAVAASDSSARSATTAVMAGWSTSSRPKAAR